MNVHYSVKDKDSFHGKKIIIAGGGDSALDWAIDYAESSEHIDQGGTVSLIHRRDEYRGAVSSVQSIKSMAESFLLFATYLGKSLTVLFRCF